MKKYLFTQLIIMTAYLAYSQTESRNNYTTNNAQTKTTTNNSATHYKENYNNESHYTNTSPQQHKHNTNNSYHEKTKTPVSKNKRYRTTAEVNDYKYKTHYTLLEQNGKKRTLNTIAYTNKSEAKSDVFLSYYDPNKKIISGGYTVPENVLLLNGKCKLKNTEGKILEEKSYKRGKLLSATINKDDYEYKYRDNSAAVIFKNNHVSYTYNTNFIGAGNDYYNKILVKDSMGNTHIVIIPGCFIWNGNILCSPQYAAFYPKKKNKILCKKACLLDWKYVEYFPNGNLKKEGVLVMDVCRRLMVPVGIWISYNEDGTINTLKNFRLYELKTHLLINTEIDIAAENKRLIFNLQNRYGIIDY